MKLPKKNAAPGLVLGASMPPTLVNGDDYARPPAVAEAAPTALAAVSKLLASTS